MKISWSDWNNLNQLHSLSFVCGYCGDRVGSSHGYFHTVRGANIYICTGCGLPTLFSSDGQFPGAIIGRSVDKLPVDVERIYEEMRDSHKNGNYTAVQLLGRKMIMHLAVSSTKAKEGDTFVHYIDHLKAAGFVPPTAGKSIDSIRDLGNEKNHEIKLGSIEQSERILKFVELLLTFMFEYSDDKGAGK
jgi:Domain of unknown function (DUF4145)